MVRLIKELESARIASLEDNEKHGWEQSVSYLGLKVEDTGVFFVYHLHPLTDFNPD